MTEKKYWSKTDEEKRLCMEWLSEPLINPETGHSIERKGPTYKLWQERCKKIGLSHKPTATKQMSWRKYQEWKKHPDKNPETGRKIKPGGRTWKWIQKTSKGVEEKEIHLQGDYFSPDIKGMVPCVKSRGTMYIVRKYQERKVWGPLNKAAYNIKLCFYRDTWDYNNKHYRPIFVNGVTPARPIIKRKDLLSTGVEKSSEKNPKKIVDSIVDLFISK